MHHTTPHNSEKNIPGISKQKYDLGWKDVKREGNGGKDIPLDCHPRVMTGLGRYDKVTYPVVIEQIHSRITAFNQVGAASIPVGFGSSTNRSVSLDMTYITKWSIGMD